MKPRDFLLILENPDAPPLMSRDAESEQLLLLLVHMFFADGKLDQGEIDLMARLVGRETDVEDFIRRLGERKLDLDKLAATFPDAKDRDDIITLAEHAVWGDDHPDYGEWDLVDQLVEKLGVIRD